MPGRTDWKNEVDYGERSRTNKKKKKTNKMIRLAIITTLCFLVFVIQAKDKPNILYIMADDHSAATVGVYESHLKDYVQTPNIDRLANEGAFLTNVVCNNSLCAPSRASILTGKYSHKNARRRIPNCCCWQMAYFRR